MQNLPAVTAMASKIQMSSTELEQRLKDATQSGALNEAVATLKENHHAVVQALGEIRQEQGKQTAVLAQIAERLKTTESHEPRLASLERSRATARGVIGSISLLGGSIGTILTNWASKHFG